jgi:hypothetical protein
MRTKAEIRKLIRPTRATQFDRFFRVHLARPVENGGKWRARKSQFREWNHGDLGCPDLRTKIFLFLKIRNREHLPAVPLPARGALRDRHERWARNAMDAVTCKTSDVYPRTAKSCGPDAPTLASSWRKVFRRRRWQKSPVTGESTK